MFRIYIRFLNRIFKTVAMGYFCCVYQKRIDTNRGKTLVYPPFSEDSQLFMLLTVHENER